MSSWKTWPNTEVPSLENMAKDRYFEPRSRSFSAKALAHMPVVNLRTGSFQAEAYPPSVQRSIPLARAHSRSPIRERQVAQGDWRSNSLNAKSFRQHRLMSIEPGVIGGKKNISTDHVPDCNESSAVVRCSCACGHQQGFADCLMRTESAQEDMQQVQNQIRQISKVWARVEDRVERWQAHPGTDHTPASLREAWEA